MHPGLIVAAAPTLLQSCAPAIRTGMHSGCFAHDSILISPVPHKRNTKWNLHSQRNQFSSLYCFALRKDDCRLRHRPRCEVLSSPFGHQDEGWGPLPHPMLKGLSSILSPAEKSGLSSLQNAILQDWSKISSSEYILLFLIFIAISSHGIWSWFCR